MALLVRTVKVGCSREIANITRDSVKPLLCRIRRSSLSKLQGLASVRRSQCPGHRPPFRPIQFSAFSSLPLERVSLERIARVKFANRLRPTSGRLESRAASICSCVLTSGSDFFECSFALATCRLWRLIALLSIGYQYKCQASPILPHIITLTVLTKWVGRKSGFRFRDIGPKRSRETVQ